MEHKEKVVTDRKNRRIILGCVCGWQQDLSNLAGANSIYADADAWANHFHLDRLIR